MKEELMKELQKRLNVFTGQAQLEMNKYHLDYLMGKIEILNDVMDLIERLDEKQHLLSIKSGPEINIDLLKNAIWYSKEYVLFRDIDFEYLIEKYKDNEFIVDYLEMCARYNKIKKAAIELLMKV